jgi:hypothetical protein
MSDEELVVVGGGLLIAAALAGLAGFALRRTRPRTVRFLYGLAIVACGGFGLVRAAHDAGDGQTLSSSSRHRRVVSAEHDPGRFHLAVWGQVGLAAFAVAVGVAGMGHALLSADPSAGSKEPGDR